MLPGSTDWVEVEGEALNDYGGDKDVDLNGDPSHRNEEEEEEEENNKVDANDEDSDDEDDDEDTQR